MPLRISMEWLRQYIDLREPAEQLAEALTLSGTEVERIINIGVGWEGVVVARIVEAELVKGSDHLKVVRLEVGDGAAQVVSGAPNIRVGDLVALAPPGTRLPNGMEISERKFMGELSQGMMCSPIELGISGEADGLLVLGTDGPTGVPLTELLPEDRVMVIEVTTNRPDLLCHLGIARELSALLRRPLSVDPADLSEDGAEPIALQVADPDLCARYSARSIEGVSVGPSPSWMQRRLRAVGQRPISNVVDAANYVMLEIGQPLHAFDRDRLEGGIVVRRAAAGESIACLDGRTRQLAPEMLVIADASRPVAIAGIIGGADSAVSGSTNRIVIEAANFNGINIRGTSRRLGLRTEASTRFEKQLHPELVPPASARMAELVQQVAGGGPSSPLLDDYPRPVVNPPIRTRAGYFAETLGDDIPDTEAVDDLTRLHFEVESGTQGLVATPPNFRLDVREPIDLVEEVGRLHGYNSLPSTLPGRRQLAERILPPPDPEWESRDIAMGAGYDEVINASFEPPGDPELGVFPTSRLRLTNPMASDQALMRTSLLPGLSRAVARNVAVDAAGVRIFELGRVFWPQPGQELPHEARVVGVATHVPAGAGQPSTAAVRAALLEVKGLFELLTERLSGAVLGAEQTAIAGLHPGRGLRLDVDGAAAGCVGQLHPELAARLGFSAVVLGELNFDAIVARPRVPRHSPVPKYPAVIRDLALTVPELTLARDAILVIREAGGAILRSVELYDEYRGAQVGEERKGLTFRLVFQSDDRTLTGEEVSAAEARIVAAARSGLSAEPRG